MEIRGIIIPKGLLKIKENGYNIMFKNYMSFDQINLLIDEFSGLFKYQNILDYLIISF